MWKSVCLFVGLLASAVADVSSVVDDILTSTRERLPNETEYRPLHYAERVFVSKSREFVQLAEFFGRNGHLLLGQFKRQGTPIVYGNKMEGILESKFLIDFKVHYENFTAVNFTSGEVSKGSMTVTYDEAEIFAWIKMNKQGSQCLTEVTTFTPISMSDPVAVFSTAEPSDLPQKLFAEAKSTLNFYMNQTLVEEGLPAFAEVVAQTKNLCALMSA